MFRVFLTIFLLSFYIIEANDTLKSKECTLSIIKPDAVEASHIGEIIARFEKAGLRIAAIKMINLTKPEAMQFYSIHKDRPFYSKLVDFMSSGPIIVMVLEGENAVALNREVIGTTDPKKANPGTIRADYASSIERNAVHGSDSLQNACQEIKFFFKSHDIHKRNSAPK
jgi:nucleoside-diphosphate kinase